MLTTLLRTIAIRTTKMKNSFIFALKKLPLIGKKLPDSLYGISAFRIIGYICGAIMEIGNAFIGKIFYLALAIITPMMMFLGLSTEPDVPELIRNIVVGDDLFYHLLFVTTFAAALLGDDIFNPSEIKSEGISMFNMDAREVLVSDAIYKFIKLIAGYLIFVPLTAFLLKIPMAGAFLFAFFSVASKLVRTAIAVFLYRKKGPSFRITFGPKATTALCFVAFIAAYLPPVFNLTIPYQVTWVLMGAFIIAAIPAFFYIRTITRSEYKVIYSNEVAQSEALKTKNSSGTIIQESSKKFISEDKAISSNKKGFEYLNDLFVKRHRKILWNSTLKTSGMLLVAFIALCIVILKLRTEGDTNTLNEIQSALMNKVHYALFVFYLFLNNGAKIAQAMFVNCDSSLLTYSFYKRPSSILNLFLIRAKTMIKINSLPAFVAAAGISVADMLTGVNDPLVYIYSFVTILAISAFFSIHYLAVYYLLQPYNEHSEMKSGKFMVVNMVVYMVCLALFQVEYIPVKIFAPIALVILAVYMTVASILVYKFAPKTFKIHN